MSDPAILTHSHLVSVIVPAYDAASTIDQTLVSVRAQTYRNLEIIVVNDGSRDATRAIAQAHHSCDPRITILDQPNGGVAAARNHGIAHSTGEYLAFIDADDLWAADKIERQLKLVVLHDHGRGANYTHFAVIDEAGCTTNTPKQSHGFADTRIALSRENIVGNGSALLVHRALVEQVGGFDAGLRAQNAQGCEDHDFYARLSDFTPVRTLPEPLTGYRQLAGRMSGDHLQMLRSRILVDRKTLARHPQFKPHARAGRLEYATWLVIRALGRRDAVTIGRIFLLLPGQRFALGWQVGRIVLRELFAITRRGRRQPQVPQRFPVGQLIDDPAADAR